MHRLHIITAAAFTLISLTLHSQNLATESKAAEISAFGGFTYQKPDVGSADHNTGGTFGVAYTRFFSRIPVEPSLELRGTDTSSNYGKERSVDFGLHVSRRFHHFHPYADFMVGVGNIVYNTDPYPGEHSDKGIAYTYGGGLDYDLVHNFRLRLDAQQQHWNLGFNSVLAPGHPTFILTPSLFTIGVNYVFPFRPHVRDSSFR